jgi:hypothetical protein
MIIVYKNYKRNDCVLLSIKSSQYFMPNAKYYCLLVYDENQNEYDENIINSLKLLNVEILFSKSKYNEGPGYGSAANGLYYTDYLNQLYAIFFNIDEKIIVMDQDMFFTNGNTLKWLNENDFDLACGQWFLPSSESNKFDRDPIYSPSAGILGFRFKALSKIFPIDEYLEFIEHILGHEVYEKAINQGLKVVQIPTRQYHNYGEDGRYTNNCEEIKSDLLNIGII